MVKLEMEKHIQWHKYKIYQFNQYLKILIMKKYSFSISFFAIYSEHLYDFDLLNNRNKVMTLKEKIIKFKFII